MEMDTKVLNELVSIDEKRIQESFIQEAIRQWDSVPSTRPLYYPAFIQIYVAQRWNELIQSN